MISGSLRRLLSDIADGTSSLAALSGVEPASQDVVFAKALLALGSDLDAIGTHLDDLDERLTAYFEAETALEQA